MTLRVFALLLLALLLPVGAVAQPASEPEEAPKSMPGTFEGAWRRMKGGDDANLIYIHAAATKFNLNPTVLAATVMADVIGQQPSWRPWAAGHPEVRSEGRFVQFAPETAMAWYLVRDELIRPRASEVFRAKQNNIAYYQNPEPGVDHWYQSMLESCGELMADDGAGIGVAARHLRRTATEVYKRSRSLNEPYHIPSEQDLERMVHQAGAWPEGSHFDWPKLQPGRDPWTVPTLAYTYAAYRATAFDGRVSDELMLLAAQSYQWLLANEEPLALLAIPPDAPPLVPYDDPSEDYTFK